VRLKANISRDRRPFERRSVVSQGQSSWITGKSRFTGLPQETLLKGGPVSSHLENTPSECIPNRRESKVSDPHRVELSQFQCDRFIASFLWLHWPDCRWRRRIREVQLSGSAGGPQSYRLRPPGECCRNLSR